MVDKGAHTYVVHMCVKRHREHDSALCSFFNIQTPFDPPTLIDIDVQNFPLHWRKLASMALSQKRVEYVHRVRRARTGEC